MGHKVYISFKTEDLSHKLTIQSLHNLEYVDKSLNEPIDSLDPDYILQRIRSEYLYDSTVTVFLIGAYSAESRGASEQYFIKKELQASLFHSVIGPKSGILGVVLPSVEAAIFGGKYTCLSCGSEHNAVNLNDATVIREFSYNYYLPNNKCAHGEEDRYCVLTRWDDFIKEPNVWIDRAFEKRSAPIATKTRVRP